MQVRTERIARVACIGYHVALAHGKLIGAKLQCHHKRLLGILFLMHQAGYLGQEAVEMAMHGGVAIVVGDVKGIAIATGSDRHLGDIAIGNGEERLAYDTLCLEVESSMKVI